MKKTFLICAILSVAFGLRAQVLQTVKEMQGKGLPKEAIPAKHYFNHLYESTSQNQKYGAFELGESSFITPDATGEGGETEHFIFVVQQPSQEDQDFPFIDLWLCNDNMARAKRVFHQYSSHYGEHVFYGIHFLSDVTTREKTYTDEKTKQIITRHLKYGKPVLALEIQEYNGTGHGIISTLIIDCETGKTTMLRGEKVVGVLSPLTNMLMLVEWNMAQSYLLTTTSTVISEDPYQPTDDFEIFSQIQLTPTLHIYTPSGEPVEALKLPTNDIDMIR